MHKRDVTCLVFGFLIASFASCRPPDDNNPSTLEPEWIETAAIADTDVEKVPPPLPLLIPESTTPLPSPVSTDNDWQSIGHPRMGIAMAIPPNWINLTNQLNIPTMDNRLGINLLFAAESERVGRSLLAGKSFVNGAYISAMMIVPPAGVADPAEALVQALNAAAPSAVRLNAVTPVVSINGVDGLVVDVADGPIGLTVSDPNDLRTRMAVFRPAALNESTEPVWIGLLLSASTDRWQHYALLFDRMLQSAAVYAVRPGAAAQEGNIIVRGELRGDNAQVGASLDSDVIDLWTFTSTGGRYASLFLKPEDPSLDLTLTLLGPDRGTVTRLENGFAGMWESAADVWLSQPGVYIVQISDLLHNHGRYTLSLEISDQPLYGGGGPFAFGQVMQGQLPANGRHYWVFSGVARQRISIVVKPAAPTFDAILELVGPDGRQLVTLDEGFSGDPELISGYELPSTGEYAILVSSFSPQGGPYTISLEEGGQPVANYFDAGDLTYGSVKTAVLQRREAHAWFLQGAAGDHILVRVSPLNDQIDLDIWLLDNNIERITAADEFAAGESETIEMTLAADGRYIVLVRDFNGEAGEYEIALGAAPAATPEHAGSLSYGDTIFGRIDAGTAVGWLFNAAAGDLIDIHVQAADAGSDIVVQLQAPDGTNMLEVDQSSAGGDESLHAYVIPISGQWRVVLREFFGSAADYRLSISRTR